MRKMFVFAAILFAATLLAAPASAQSDPTGRYALHDRNDSFVVEIARSGSGYLVTGSYTLDGQACQISGSYFSATRKIKAQCRSGRSSVAVNGSIEFRQGESSTSALLTIEIHNRQRSTYRTEKGITGYWRITQTGANGSRYTGTFVVTQNGTNLAGQASWDNHSTGRISGNIFDGRVRITVTYAEGLIGTYVADLANGGTRMVGGTATSNRGGGSASWTGTRMQ